MQREIYCTILSVGIRDVPQKMFNCPDEWRLNIHISGNGMSAIVCILRKIWINAANESICIRYMALVNEFDKQNYSFYCKLNFVNGAVVVVIMMLHRMLYE